MQNTLLFGIIQSLTKKEIRTLSQFVRSPFFNQRKYLIRFFDYLADCLEHDMRPDEQKAFQKTYPKMDFDAQKMRLTCSYLLRLVEQFLIQIEQQEDAYFYKNHLLLKAYRKRHLDSHFQKTYKKQKALQEKQEWRHPEFYFSAFLLENEQYLYLASTKRTEELHLQQVEENLDYALLSMKLRQACFSIAHKAVYQTEYRNTLLEELLNTASLEAFQKIPAIAVYYYCYMALSQPAQEQYFQQFKQQLFEHIEQFSRQDVHGLYLLAINFCIKKINQNQKIYLKEALDLYKKGLEIGLLTEGGKISHFTYNNMVGIGLHLEELLWVEWFVNAYKTYLEPAFREVTYNLNAARLEYTRQHYKKALIHLQSADYKDLINNLLAKTLQLKIYYELEEFDLLDTHLNAMQTFINRKKKLSYHQQNFLNIVNMTRRLLTLNPYDKMAKLELKQAMEEEKILTEKAWLLAQLEKK